MKTQAWSLLVMMVLAGCGREQSIDQTYGRRRGAEGGASVNGTRVLARMFEQAGHRVVTHRRLAPALERVDVVVWTPDDFHPPSTEAIQFLEDWLQSKPARTLVYVGRDFDASLLYWEKMLSRAPPELALEVKRRWAAARAEYDAARQATPEKQDCDWFISQRWGSGSRVESLRGRWSRGIDASQTEIYLAGQFEFPSQRSFEDVAVLLESSGRPLVSRLRGGAIGRGQILVVTNGSFLLNLPLVNHEHRKLAGRLIAECQPARRVALLESGPGGPAISDEEAELHHLLKVFTLWPINCILLHLAVLGFVLCLAIFPVFGRPRELVDESRSDFGKHIHALAELLERTADKQYARDRLENYRQALKREVGSSLPGTKRLSTSFGRAAKGNSSAEIQASTKTPPGKSE